MTRHAQRLALSFIVLFAMTLTVLAPGNGQARQATTDEHRVFFGWLLATTDLVAVAIDVGAVDDAGMVPVLAYVCDGLGAPDGMAVWFKGSVDPSEVQQSGQFVDLTSPTGQETLTIGHLDDYGVRGMFTRGDGPPVRFATFRAIDSAGIYDVTLDEERHYTGTSTDGATLSANILEDGHVKGAILTANGAVIDFYVQAMALAPPEQLAEFGVPVTYTDFAEQSIVPGSYVAVISPGGAFWLGRSGAVRSGKPGTRIIGLDMSD